MPKDLTIEKSKYGSGYSVYEFGTYERSSVLAGQTRKQFLDGFETLEEAQEKFPSATVGFRDAGNTFGHLPGDDCLDGQGGVWGEEDSIDQSWDAHKEGW